VQVEEDGVRREYINGLPKMTDAESAQWEYDQAEGLGQAAAVAVDDTEKENTVNDNTVEEVAEQADALAAVEGDTADLGEAIKAESADAEAGEGVYGDAEAMADRDASQAQAEADRAEQAEAPKVPAQPKARRKAEPKAKPEPKRAPLPEGYTTPVGLAKLINETGRYHGEREDGLTSQSMYVYIKTNGEGSTNPFPIETIDGRVCVNIEAGLAWWDAKEARVAAKKEAAEKARQAKADAKAAREAAKATSK
jgi:hypothetical protein